MNTDPSVVVNGIRVKIARYSAKKFEQLQAVVADIDAWVEKHPETLISEVPAEKKAEWYRRRAEIIWVPETPFPKDFFESPDFEVSVLRETENFFVSHATYL